MEDALEEMALICVISCNGQSLLKVPYLLMSQCHLYCTAKIFTGCQRADFLSDLRSLSRLLSQNVVLLCTQNFVGNNSFSIKSRITRLVPSMLSIHVVAGPKPDQGCRSTQQSGAEICCLFLRRPWCRLLACCARASCMPAVVGICLCFQLSRVQTQSMLLGGPGSCIEECWGRLQKICTQHSGPLQGRQHIPTKSALAGYMSWNCHPDTLLRRKFVQLVS